jgi:exodeoxyribonuclease III
MRIATWNVNGIRKRQPEFLAWIAYEQPDVVCVQETKASPEQLEDALCQLPGYCCFWHGAGGYSGVNLSVRSDTIGEPVFSHTTFDRETRVVLATFGSSLTVASIYVPNGGKDFVDKMVFLGEMEEWAGDMIASGNQLIICGDMNITRTDMDVHPKERKPKAVGQRPEEREAFERILRHGFTDLGRHFDPDNDGLFTWWAPWRDMRKRNIGWRLDYILASPEMTKAATGCIVQALVGTSDHAPVVATFDI